jgi:hypothetical protein
MMTISTQQTILKAKGTQQPITTEISTQQLILIEKNPIEKAPHQHTVSL